MFAFLTALAGSAWAATQTVTLSVPDMTCSACPLTVKAALMKIAGVNKVEISLETKEAVVTFDDAKTSAAALTLATAGAGYPSTLKHPETAKR
jgi:mercuric ion binding protein